MYLLKMTDSHGNKATRESDSIPSVAEIQSCCKEWVENLDLETGERKNVTVEWEFFNEQGDLTDYGKWTPE